MESSSIHYDIVIAGGGAGGLELAARLGRRLGRKAGREKVLLIDRSVFHIWKPTLHEVAAGTLNIHQEGLSYAMLARRNHFSYALGEVVALDATRKTIQLGEIRDGDDDSVVVPARSVQFNQCVLAFGCGSNFFGIKGGEFAHILEQAGDAERFRRHLIAAFTRAAFAPSMPLRIAIVGGGATGVELAAELQEAHRVFEGEVDEEHRFGFEITIVEAGPRILGGLSERISKQAAEVLERRKVRLLVDTPVVDIRPHLLITRSGEIAADLIVWAAGIKGADVNATLGLTVNRANQFVVDDQLHTSAADIYAFGDCAACPWTSGTLVPARAQAAHQESSYLADTLLARLRGRKFDRTFMYRDLGSLVSLGDHKGIGSLMGGLFGRSFFIEGLLAKWMYMSLHLMHHMAILGIGRTIVLALARLLQHRVSGRLKLH